MQHEDQGEHRALADQLGRARRRAFSRGATEADLADLRRLEERAERAQVLLARSGAPADPAEPETALDPEAADPPAGDREEDQPEHEGSARRTWMRPALLGAVAGILVGLLVATVGSPLFGARRPLGVVVTEGSDPNGLASSLTIFDRTPTERDILGAAGFPESIFEPRSGEPEVRWLADIDGSTVYAARGEQGGETVICLLIVGGSTAGAGCSPVADFEISGLGGTVDGLAVRWGPYGLAPWLPYQPDAQEQ